MILDILFDSEFIIMERDVGSGGNYVIPFITDELYLYIPKKSSVFSSVF